nr:uncharacterized protein LOC123497660 [Aegilops tauschii subsp. strangulata]
MEYSARGSRRFVKKKKRPQEDHGLASSPSHPRRRHHHPRRLLPATSDAAQHAPELPTVRASLPSGQILRSGPLPPARNPTPVARVSGRASPARLRRTQEFFVSVKGISASENQVAEITNETDGRKVDPSKTDITPGMQGEEEHNKLSGKETAL